MSTLYIVGTPIGNLKDITFRALETLKAVDIIAAEDTRVSLKLLNHYEISGRMISYHEHNKRSSGEKIINALREGLDVALITDAGLPGISDPGEDIIREAIEKGFDIVSIPGPSASLTALQLSGLPTDKFIFEGFLPPKEVARKKALEGIKHNKYTTIIYESPHRVLSLLEDMVEVLGDRKISLSRELTKKFEETFRGTSKDALDYFKDGIKGEIVICLDGYIEEESVMDDIIKEVQDFVMAGGSKRDAAIKFSEKYGLPKNKLKKIIQGEIDV